MEVVRQSSDNAQLLACRGCCALTLCVLAAVLQHAAHGLDGGTQPTGDNDAIRVCNGVEQVEQSQTSATGVGLGEVA